MQSAIQTPELIHSAHALEHKVAYRSWPELAAVRVRGDDRLTWLNGQITNDVRAIPPGGSVRALAVNVRGKIMAELWVADLGESLLLLVPSATQDTLLESFERFIIMEDVVLERAPELQVLGLEGPLSAASAQRIESGETTALSGTHLGLGGHFWVGTQAALAHITAQLTAAGVPSVPEAAYELVRLRLGQPHYGVDFDEHHYPQEAGLKSIVSFQKGCYLGQEVVCTLENRGKLSRRLCVLQGTSETLPAPESKLLDPANANAATTDALGTVTSAAWDPERKLSYVLGYVKRAYAQADATVQCDGQVLTIVKLVGEEEPAPASA